MKNIAQAENKQSQKMRNTSLDLSALPLEFT